MHVCTVCDKSIYPQNIFLFDIQLNTKSSVQIMLCMLFLGNQLNSKVGILHGWGSLNFALKIRHENDIMKTDNQFA